MESIKEETESQNNENELLDEKSIEQKNRKNQLLKKAFRSDYLVINDLKAPQYTYGSCFI
ncbi:MULTISPECIES: hypothetical protein [Staphylococcus]|nr:hypothetical protein BUY26_12285 [Staphylococcus cohnii]PUZ30646.1 hypothetical protein BUY27_14070 [Staphylococcus cohnii]RIL83799.1 hypothetical protein BUY33_08665 [Staphylococcus cohnii]